MDATIPASEALDSLRQSSRRARVRPRCAGGKHGVAPTDLGVHRGGPTRGRFAMDHRGISPSRDGCPIRKRLLAYGRPVDSPRRMGCSRTADGTPTRSAWSRLVTQRRFRNRHHGRSRGGGWRSGSSCRADLNPARARVLAVSWLCHRGVGSPRLGCSCRCAHSKRCVAGPRSCWACLSARCFGMGTRLARSRRSLRASSSAISPRFPHGSVRKSCYRCRTPRTQVPGIRGKSLPSDNCDVPASCSGPWRGGRSADSGFGRT